MSFFWDHVFHRADGRMTDMVETGSKLARFGTGGYSNILHDFTRYRVHSYGMHPTRFTLFLDINPSVFNLFANKNSWMFFVFFTTLLYM